MLFRSIVDLFVLLLLVHCSYIVLVMSCERHFFWVNIHVCTYILHCTHTASLYVYIQDKALSINSANTLDCYVTMAWWCVVLYYTVVYGGVCGPSYISHVNVGGDQGVLCNLSSLSLPTAGPSSNGLTTSFYPTK